MSSQVASGPLRIGPRGIAAILLVALVGAMAIEPTRQLLEQRTRIAKMSRDVRRLDRSNRALQVRIDRLKDPDFLEQQAREQLGLVRAGETTYVVVAPNRQRRQGNGRPKRIKRVREAPQEPSFVERMFRFLGV